MWCWFCLWSQPCTGFADNVLDNKRCQLRRTMMTLRVLLARKSLAINLLSHLSAKCVDGAQVNFECICSYCITYSNCWSLRPACLYLICTACNGHTKSRRLFWFIFTFLTSVSSVFSVFVNRNMCVQYTFVSNTSKDSQHIAGPSDKQHTS